MPILTLNDLAVHTNRTSNRKVSMSLLSQFYETYLFSNYYDFELTNGNTIRIDFHKKNFCHLIGIEQIAEEHFRPNDPKLFMHKGLGGFKRAKSGKLEFSYLRNLHQYEYEYQEKHKFYHFHFLHTMMDSGNLKLVNYTTVANSTIKCDFMFHDTYDNALLHLGVEKSGSTGNFFPKTFFARYLTDADVDMYIKPQTPVGIEQLKKVART
jgi:hypothetical protein